MCVGAHCSIANTKFRIEQMTKLWYKLNWECNQKDRGKNCENN